MQCPLLQTWRHTFKWPTCERNIESFFCAKAFLFCASSLLCSSSIHWLCLPLAFVVAVAGGRGMSERSFLCLMLVQALHWQRTGSDLSYSVKSQPGPAIKRSPECLRTIISFHSLILYWYIQQHRYTWGRPYLKACSGCVYIRLSGVKPVTLDMKMGPATNHDFSLSSGKWSVFSFTQNWVDYLFIRDIMHVQD